ncbi:MAG: hypothetical protein RLZZ618_2012, partial [Pseudomonadota bacterium]
MKRPLFTDRRRLLRGGAWLLCGSLPAWSWAQTAVVPASLPAEVRTELPTARLQGAGRLSFLGLRIYDSKLWVDPAFTAENFERHPLALELVYARSLDGKQIAERSLTEMKRAGPLDDTRAAAWLADMGATFPDVSANDRITGAYQPGGSLRFFLNGKLLREFRDAEFA